MPPQHEEDQYEDPAAAGGQYEDQYEDPDAGGQYDDAAAAGGQYEDPAAAGGQYEEEYIEVEVFNVGERVSAQWSDMAFYPAEIRAVMEETQQYKVEFPEYEPGIIYDLGLDQVRPLEEDE